MFINNCTINKYVIYYYNNYIIQRKISASCFWNSRGGKLYEEKKSKYHFISTCLFGVRICLLQTYTKL